MLWLQATRWKKKLKVVSFYFAFQLIALNSMKTFVFYFLYYFVCHWQIVLLHNIGIIIDKVNVQRLQRFIFCMYSLLQRAIFSRRFR